MSTDKNEFKRGLKYVFGAIPLFVLAPVILNIGFSALKKDNTSIFLIIGIIAAFAGILLVFKGIKITLAALFNK
ncbi:DUF6095 family protein [Flavicella sediminum]|uniref:DUF6095 family protein n=1 Tax=Flavicella sediminum TaxID=2585141 RepID=UPI00111DCCED|nr:DUF6095 family protein [Flavicella sediminum]